MVLMGGIRMCTEEKREREENAENDGDSRSEECESWDPWTSKSKVHHFWCQNQREKEWRMVDSAPTHSIQTLIMYSDFSQRETEKGRHRFDVL